MVWVKSRNGRERDRDRERQRQRDRTKQNLSLALTLIPRASDIWDKCGRSKSNEDFSGKTPSSGVPIPNAGLFLCNSCLIGLNGEQTWPQKDERWDIVLAA